MDAATRARVIAKAWVNQSDGYGDAPKTDLDMADTLEELANAVLGRESLGLLDISTDEGV